MDAGAMTAIQPRHLAVFIASTHAPQVFALLAQRFPNVSIYRIAAHGRAAVTPYRVATPDGTTGTLQDPRASHCVWVGVPQRVVERCGDYNVRRHALRGVPDAWSTELSAEGLVTAIAAMRGQLAQDDAALAAAERARKQAVAPAPRRRAPAPPWFIPSMPSPRA